MFYRRCRKCREADPTVSWRADNCAVLCIECHLDALRDKRIAEAVLAAEAFLMVRMSPAALKAMAEAEA